jgi:hypothetical protein
VPTPRFEVINSAGGKLAARLESPGRAQARAPGIQCRPGLRRARGGLDGALAEAFRHDSEVLCEERIMGRETTVGVLEGEALPVVEVRPHSGVYDYRSKYTTGATDYLCPAPFDAALTARIQAAGLGAFHAVGARDYARTDVMVTRAGEPLVLEVNTLPGMTEMSLLPKAAAAAGIGYAELCERMVRLALRRARPSPASTEPADGNALTLERSGRMWPFSQQPVNRRVERRAASRCGSAPRWPRPRPRAGSAPSFSPILGTLLALFVFWRAGEWLLHNFLFDDQSYGLRQVEISTDGLLRTDEIQRRAGRAIGPEPRGAGPRAHQAGTGKRPPDPVRHAGARAAQHAAPARHGAPARRRGASRPAAARWLDAVHHLPPGRRRDGDAAGGSAQPPAGQPPVPYPLIVGLDPAELVPGQRVRSGPASAALRLVAAFEESAMVGLDDLQRVEIVSPEVLQAATYLGAQVTFSTQHVERQLARWRAIFDYGQARQLHLAALDLAVSNNVPARWFEAGSMPAPPREPRTPRTRTRRHV